MSTTAVLLRPGAWQVPHTDYTAFASLAHQCLLETVIVFFLGVPVLSFDTVSIDSDLDTVCTEQVRQHVRKWPGKRLNMEEGELVCSYV